LRHQLRQRRRELSASVRLAAAEALAEQLRALPFATIEGYVGGYWATDGEIALHRWQMQLAARQRYCLPVLYENQLRFAPWQPGEPLQPNRYGIPEPVIDPARALLPEAMAFVVIPLTGFTAQGQRLGMGGGWYDRSFHFRQHRTAPPWLVGVGFAAQQLPSLVSQPWDVMMDAVCTEHGTFYSDISLK